MLQVGRNLTDVVSGFLRGKRYLLMDRDNAFSAAFRGLLKSAGVDRSGSRHSRPTATRSWSDSMARSSARSLIEWSFSERSTCVVLSASISSITTGSEIIRG